MRRTRSASWCTTRRPMSARRSSKDTSYGEVESVKAVSDLISPLSGEVLEVNQKVVDAPETVNEDPYGDGWLIRIRLTNPDELGAAARRRGLPEGPRGRAVSYPLADRCRPRRDAGDDRRLVRRRALSRHPGGDALRTVSSTSLPALDRARAATPSGGARRARTWSTRSASSARASTTTTSRRSSTRCCSAASC